MCISALFSPLRNPSCGRLASPPPQTPTPSHSLRCCTASAVNETQAPRRDSMKPKWVFNRFNTQPNQTLLRQPSYSTVMQDLSKDCCEFVSSWLSPVTNPFLGRPAPPPSRLSKTTNTRQQQQQQQQQPTHFNFAPFSFQRNSGTNALRAMDNRRRSSKLDWLRVGLIVLLGLRRYNVRFQAAV